MKNIYIQLNNNIQLNIDLFHLLLKIYIYFDNIYIIDNLDKNILFYYQLFFNFNNVIFIKKSNNNIIRFNEITELIKIVNNYINIENENNLNNFNFINNINYKYIYRNIKEETYIYNKLMKIINNKYIFYYNENKNNKIINYFNDDYIYNPLFNFYDKDENYYNIWTDLNIKNIFLYLTIIKNAYEIHIFESDLLYLILLYQHEFEHITKYLYTKNIYIKEKNIHLKKWQTIIIT